MNRTILVTGGNGFLGTAIIQELQSKDSLFPDYKIRVIDLDTDSNNDGVEYIQCNIMDKEEFSKALMGCEVVIHSAAIVDWGTKLPSEVMDVNFGGTLNVIEACKIHGIKALVYTSSLDAVYRGTPLVDVDESLPYPEKPHSAYCESKAKSEVAIVEAASENFKACVIRPADVWGGGDPYHLGSLIDMSNNGFYVRLGNGTSKCQHVYVNNVAHAHLLAAKEMLDGNEKVSGSIYFITDTESENFFTFFEKIIDGAGYNVWPRNFWLPKWFAYSIASISEFAAWLWRPIHHYNPKFSRFAVSYTCTDFTFSSAKAKNDFGFIPKYSHDEAFNTTVGYYKNRK